MGHWTTSLKSRQQTLSSITMVTKTAANLAWHRVTITAFLRSVWTAIIYKACRTTHSLQLSTPALEHAVKAISCHSITTARAQSATQALVNYRSAGELTAVVTSMRGVAHSMCRTIFSQVAELLYLLQP